MHAENTQQQLTFLALLPWPKTKFWTDFCLTNQTTRSTGRPKSREKDDIILIFEKFYVHLMLLKKANYLTSITVFIVESTI